MKPPVFRALNTIDDHAQPVDNTKYGTFPFFFVRPDHSSLPLILVFQVVKHVIVALHEKRRH